MQSEGIEAFLKKGDWASAEHASLAALQVCPTNAKLHAYLGMSLFRQGKFEAAIPSFQRATILDPNFCDAAVKLVQCYDRLHRYEEAFRIAKEWLTTFPANTSLQGIVYGLELQVKGNRTDGWERTAHVSRDVRFAEDV